MIKAERFSGKHVWTAITNLPQVVCWSASNISGNNSGIAPVTFATLSMINTLPWHQHFTSVLNILSTFHVTVFDSLKQEDIDDSLALSPSEDEVIVAMRHLLNSKSGGTSGIVPELLKVGAPSLCPVLLDLMQASLG